MATVLIPIPNKDFDPTEVAVSWKVLNLGGRLVGSEPHINRLPQEPVLGPGQIGNLDDEPWLDPMHAGQDQRRSEAGLPARCGAKRRASPRQGVEATT